MTFEELKERLRDAGVENYRGEAAIIAETFCGISPYRLAWSDAELPDDAVAEPLKRRLAGEPLQYIVGEWDFMSETYEVTPAVLIPRQDTETLVEWAIAQIPRGGSFADLCTGSGCIAVSTLAARDDLSCAAVDKYPEALEIAVKNAKRNGVYDRVVFALCDVLTDEPYGGPYDAILSNPPYVSADEYRSLQKEIYFEPRHALTDGADGLTFYRAILEKYRSALKDGGAIVFEVGESQAGAVCALAAERGMTSEGIADLSGRERVVICRKLSEEQGKV